MEITEINTSETQIVIEADEPLAGASLGGRPLRLEERPLRVQLLLVLDATMGSAALQRGIDALQEATRAPSVESWAVYLAGDRVHPVAAVGREDFGPAAQIAIEAHRKEKRTVLYDAAQFALADRGDADLPVLVLTSDFVDHSGLSRADVAQHVREARGVVLPWFVADHEGDVGARGRAEALALAMEVGVPLTDLALGVPSLESSLEAAMAARHVYVAQTPFHPMGRVELRVDGISGARVFEEVSFSTERVDPWERRLKIAVVALVGSATSAAAAFLIGLARRHRADAVDLSDAFVDRTEPEPPDHDQTEPDPGPEVARLVGEDKVWIVHANGRWSSAGRRCPGSVASAGSTSGSSPSATTSTSKTWAA